jgi:hypothetical protein
MYMSNCWGSMRRGRRKGEDTEGLKGWTYTKYIHIKTV